MCILCICISCNENTVYDFPGDSVNRVFIANLDYTVNGNETSKLGILKTPFFIFSDGIEIPVCSTLNANGEIGVSVKIDPSLVESFNENYKTSYDMFPLELLNVQNLEQKIPSNKMKTEGNIILSLKKDVEFTLKTGIYLIPLRIDKVSDNAVISTNKGQSFVLVDVAVDEDNINETEGNPEGEMYSGDRLGWTVSLENAKFYGHEPDEKVSWMIFDGENGTKLSFTPNRGSNAPSAFIVDMKEEFEVTAVYQKFSMREFAIRGCEFYSSTDGVNWISIGAVANKNAQITTKFYFPIKARYLKVVVTNIRYAFADIQEFNIYIK